MLNVRNGYMSQLEMGTRIRLKGEIPRLGVWELEVQAMTDPSTSLGSLWPCWASVSGLQNRIARVQACNVSPQAQGLNTKSLVIVLKLWDLDGAKSWKRWAFESWPVLCLTWLPVHTIAWFWSAFLSTPLPDSGLDSCPYHTCFLSDILFTPCKLCSHTMTVWERSEILSSNSSSPLQLFLLGVLVAVTLPWRTQGKKRGP